MSTAAVSFSELSIHPLRLTMICSAISLLIAFSIIIFDPRIRSTLPTLREVATMALGDRMLNAISSAVGIFPPRRRPDAAATTSPPPLTVIRVRDDDDRERQLEINDRRPERIEASVAEWCRLHGIGPQHIPTIVDGALRAVFSVCGVTSPTAHSANPLCNRFPPSTASADRMENAGDRKDEVRSSAKGSVGGKAPRGPEPAAAPPPQAREAAGGEECEDGFDLFDCQARWPYERCVAMRRTCEASGRWVELAPHRPSRRRAAEVDEDEGGGDQGEGLDHAGYPQAGGWDIASADAAEGGEFEEEGRASRTWARSSSRRTGPEAGAAARQAEDDEAELEGGPGAGWEPTLPPKRQADGARGTGAHSRGKRASAAAAAAAIAAKEVAVAALVCEACRRVGGLMYKQVQARLAILAPQTPHRP